MSYLRTILCATDFFDCSRHAFRLARSLAIEQESRLVIVHVIPTLGSMVAFEDALKQLEPKDAGEKLWEVLRRFQVSNAKVQVEHRLVSGNVAEEILRLAHQIGCDLIVMGTHGRTGLRRLIMGSVAAEVSQQAPCPVITVRTPHSVARSAHHSTKETTGGEASLTLIAAG